MSEGGLIASELLARSLLWQGNAAEAEETLSSFDPQQMDEFDMVRWGLARIANLHWSMGDAESADDVLELLHEKITHNGAQQLVTGVAAASRTFENQLTEAVDRLGKAARVERMGRLARFDRKAPRRQDVAPVDLPGHQVPGDAVAPLPVHQRPCRRVEAGIIGQRTIVTGRYATCGSIRSATAT